MNIELAQFLASHRKNYPKGFVVGASQPAALILFVSEKDLSHEERLLIEGAAEKGLRLTKGQYAIGKPSEIPAGATVIALGAAVPGNAGKVIATHHAHEILGDPKKKREFWESIKGLTG